MLVTGIVITCCGLSPLYVIIMDFIITIVWAVAFGMLVKAMGTTTTDSCTADNWGNSEGIRICHAFKTLVAFSVLGLVSMVAMVGTAVVIRKRVGTHLYEPAANPVAMDRINTSYKPMQSNNNSEIYSNTDNTYGAPPPAYNPPNPPTFAQPEQAWQTWQTHAPERQQQSSFSPTR